MFKQVLLVLMFTTSVWAGGEAIFGLRWLSSPKQIRDQGISLRLTNSNEYLYIYVTDSLPKNHSFAESYALVFYRDSILVKIKMISASVTNDPYGTEGREKFDLIISQLSSKMKLQNKFCYVGAKVYQESDEFYQCLDYPGCGNWAAVLYDNTKSVLVELKPLRRAEGYIVITAEANEFEEISKRIKANRNKSDASAF